MKITKSGWSTSASLVVTNSYPAMGLPPGRVFMVPDVTISRPFAGARLN